MTSDPDAFLRSLYQINVTTIADDIARVDEKAKSWAIEVREFENSPNELKTPESEAYYAHLNMVLVHVMLHMDLPREIETYYAAFGADNIISAVMLAAEQKGRLAEVGQEMERLVDAQKMSGFSILMVDPELDALTDEMINLMASIRTTVITSLYRRYHLGYYADLYEQDRARYDMEKTVGQRIVFPLPAEITKKLDRAFQYSWGREALEKMQNRVNQLSKYKA